MQHATDLPIDRRLLRRLQRGEQAAWTTIVNSWAARLHAYLCYILPDPAEAEAVLQEVFVAAVRSLPTLDRGVAASTWLYALAQHKAADAWRRTRTNSPLSWSLTHIPADHRPVFRQALASLPEQTRHALLLHYRETLSIAEVADVLGRTYKATEALIQRGEVLLQAALAPELVDHA